jgi:hypothetical protein
MLRIRRAFRDCDVTWVTTLAPLARDLPGERVLIVPEVSRWDRIRLVWCAIRLTFIVLSVWPDAAVSTGAAPGFLALRIAHILGIRTLWLDSVANADELSLSGRKALSFADCVLTQWPALAEADSHGGRRPNFAGSVV